jgi:hypothetical protein
MPRPRAKVLGKRFGRLVVVGFSRDTSGRTLAVCRCDCGEVCRVRPANLRSRNSQSCRCLFRQICRLAPADRGLWPAAIAVSWEPQQMEVRDAA